MEILCWLGACSLLHLSQPSYLKEPRKQPLSTRSHNLKDMLLYANTFSDKLYYEVMEEPVAELENKKEITVQFFNAKAEKEVCFLSPHFCCFPVIFVDAVVVMFLSHVVVGVLCVVSSFRTCVFFTPLSRSVFTLCMACLRLLVPAACTNSHSKVLF